MAKVFITGSADGLGLMTGRLLVEQGHTVVLHARNAERAADTRRALPEATSVVFGELSRIDEMKNVARQANEIGAFDAVVHNVGIGYREPRRILTPDGLCHLFAVNVLSPYVLTALMHRPKRLIYLSSGMHRGGDPDLSDLQWEHRRWNGAQAYSDSKLFDVILAFSVARRWRDVASNALEPGWVPTKMGGPGAPDDLDQAHRTQAWLAAGVDRRALASGRYYYHLQEKPTHPSVRNEELQDRFLDACAAASGVSFPDGV